MAFPNSSCSYCVDNKTTSSIYRGCSTCHRRHGHEVNVLKSDLKKLQDEVAVCKKTYEDSLSEIEELRKQKTKYKDMLKQVTDACKNHTSKACFLETGRDAAHQNVMINTGGHSIAAHSLILAARSKFFKTMFRAILTVQKPIEVTLKICGVSASVVEAVVSFCYSGEITFLETVPPDEVLRLAQRLQLDNLSDVCDLELSKSICVANLPQMIQISRTLPGGRAETLVWQFVQEHFDQLNFKDVFENFEPAENIVVEKESES